MRRKKTQRRMGETMSNAVARKLDSIRNKGGLKNIDVANVLGMRPEQVSRWNQGKAFPQPDAEKTLLELEYIVDELSDFYDPQEARLWLFSRQKLLDGQTPAELIQKGRTDEVRNMIAQLRDGVFI
jgi:transcriptional regulator with XRE-family HTH domain